MRWGARSSADVGKPVTRRIPPASGCAHTKPRRDVGSRVFQFFEGAGHIRLGEHSDAVSRGDLIVVPSWVPWSLHADTEFDLFVFSDAPIVESLHFHHTHHIQRSLIAIKLATVRIDGTTAAVRVAMKTTPSTPL